MGVFMQWLELLGLVSVVGLIFTSENRNNGVSQFINSVGTFNTTFVKGVGPS